MSLPAASALEEAQASLRDGAFERAIELFTEGLANDPDNADAYRGRALAHVQLKHWSSAIADFTNARQLHPEDQESWVGLGMSLAMDSRVYEAIDVFHTLLAAHPDYARGHIQLGLLYFQLCATGKGRREMADALACRPSLAERRVIEQVLKEQDALDKKRYFRPDFEALRARQHHPRILKARGA